MSSKNKNKNGAKSENEFLESSPNIQETQEIVAGQTVVLENNIPIPAPTRTKHKYPFNTMKTGQSFPIPRKTSAASVQIAYWKKKLPGVDYSARALQKEEIEVLKTRGIFSADVTEGSRIWRTDGMVEVAK